MYTWCIPSPGSHIHTIVIQKKKTPIFIRNSFYINKPYFLMKICILKMIHAKLWFLHRPVLSCFHVMNNLIATSFYLLINLFFSLMPHLNNLHRMSSFIHGFCFLDKKSWSSWLLGSIARLACVRLGSVRTRGLCLRTISAMTLLLWRLLPKNMRPLKLILMPTKSVYKLSLQYPMNYNRRTTMTFPELLSGRSTQHLNYCVLFTQGPFLDFWYWLFCLNCFLFAKLIKTWQ